MAKRLDQILVVDVEATCWEGAPPPGEENEIIEVGVGTLDVTSCEPIEARSLLVRPERSRVSPFCTGLTSLTQEQVDGGIPFREACATLRDHYHARDRLWASYGDYDRRQFERQCQARGVAYPFGGSHLNVKTLFATVLALPHEVGMAEALKRLGLTLEGVHHRGGDDAHNIMRILRRLLMAARAGMTALTPP